MLKRYIRRLSTAAESETARISACNALLERAYGKSLPGRSIVIDLPVPTLSKVSNLI